MVHPLPTLHGLVMAGGHGTRMGTDKALLEYGDGPQVLATWRLVRPCVLECFVSLRADQCDEPVRRTLPGILDGLVGIGPAAGLLAAHAMHPEAAWLVVACDLPLLQASTLTALVAARDGRHAAIAYADPERASTEPLCTVWEPEALRALARRAGEGQYGLRAALAQVCTLVLAAPADRSLLNINTPQERAELETPLLPTRPDEASLLPPPLQKGD